MILYQNVLVESDDIFCDRGIESKECNQKDQLVLINHMDLIKTQNPQFCNVRYFALIS